jgi:hypothetical protein
VQDAAYALLVLIAGFGLMWLSKIGWFNSHTAPHATANQFGGLLVTTGGLAALWELRAKRDFMGEMLENARIASDVTAAGIDRVTMQWIDVPWDELFKSSKRSSSPTEAAGAICTGRKSSSLPGQEQFLRLFLPDPDDEAAMSVLARRYAYTSEKIRNHVVETVEEFAKLGMSCAADLRIY